MFRPALVWMLSLAPLTVAVAAQSPDMPEAGSVEAIAAATTNPHFVSPWVSYVPASNTVPSPEKFFGRIMGAPGELLGTEKTYAYARTLAAASPRVRVFTIGHSEEGRDIVMLAIADEAGIRDLDRLKAATAALADPRRYDLLCEISRAGGTLACENLRGCTEVSAATVSHHMKELETAGLVESTRDGKFVTYRLRRDVLEAYLGRMAQI